MARGLCPLVQEVDISALLGGDSYAPVAAETAAITSKLSVPVRASASVMATESEPPSSGGDGGGGGQEAGQGRAEANEAAKEELAEPKEHQKGAATSTFVPSIFAGKSSAKVHPDVSQDENQV
mgnify:CR=1 FL=1|eukprot:189523-Prorocentrum_minimum.AAC.4